MRLRLNFQFDLAITTYRLEFTDLLDDLSSVGICHGDFKFNNVLDISHTSPDIVAQKVCPRHQRIHSYRVVDFDRSRKWGKTAAEDDEIFINL